VSDTDLIRSWTDEEARASLGASERELARHPAGDLDEELRQLQLVEALVINAGSSCATNCTAQCSGGICCF
jgi:mersacidin/lichenicidin family type 2 lantibiotic